MTSSRTASIVIPACNPHNVHTLVVHLLEQNRKHYLEIIPVIQSEGQGYVAPSNQGLRACSSDTDILIVLNDDVTFVEEAWIDILLNAIEGGHDVVSSKPYAGEQFAGWCVGFSPQGYRLLKGFNPIYVHWQGDVDLLERCDAMGLSWKATEARVDHDRSSPFRWHNEFANLAQKYVDIDDQTRRVQLNNEQV